MQGAFNWLWQLTNASSGSVSSDLCWKVEKNNKKQVNASI
jgi:hypothetical protein